MMQRTLRGLRIGTAALLIGMAACNAIIGIQHGIPLDEETGATGSPMGCPEVPCYTGPAETRGKGICKDGALACDAEGNATGACEGQVLPSAEVCGDAEGADEDCDGEADEAEECACGDGQVSDGEACDDGGRADGDGCSATCEKETVVMVAGGLDHACALLSSGVVKCWGYNGDGELGLGHTTARGDEPNEMGLALPIVDLGPGEKALSISASWRHTCALLMGGRVKCWGGNASAQLGVGDTQNRGDNPGEMGSHLPAVDLGPNVEVTAIAAGDDHTCALIKGGKVKCWGANQVGQLGLGDTAQRGDEASDMGENLPYVDLGANKVAVGLASGAGHTCALFADGSVKCWGLNYRGQLGLGDSENRGDEGSETGNNLPAVDLGDGVKAEGIYAGSYHTCALLVGGESLKCWGHNDDGELGLGHTKRTGDGPNEMGDNLPAVSFGDGKTLVSLSGGEGHSCAALNDGTVKCWGWNSEGQLGLGDTVSRGGALGQTLDKLPYVNIGIGEMAASIAAGDHSTCAVLAGGRVKCWGSNNYGELGLGDTKLRGDGPNEMGDNLPTVKLF